MAAAPLLAAGGPGTATAPVVPEARAPGRGMRWLLLPVGGVFLVYGTLEVPEGDCGEEAAEPGGGPEVLDGADQGGSRGVSGAAGVVGRR
ncbi:hypothetical protein [Streptomyces cyaneofuscatus]|uniref:hypothetical protein n=1 Tax=Streptomyces cyaneofuscatus TaxID=66883 RepID=UPI002FF1FCC4